MKSITRRAAESILRVTLGSQPSTHREWADAMHAELDFIEDDWSALMWAIGGASAMAKRSFTDLLFGSEARGFALGVGLAAALLLAALGVLWLVMSYPGISFANNESFRLVVAILVPEMIFIGAVIALRKKQKPVAAGIAVPAIVLAAHVAIHIATHGW